jgi:hypothetical protein
VSNSNNLGKELKRLRKELAALGAKDKKFHYIIGDPNEAAEARLERLIADGKIAKGDEYQLIDIAWTPRVLRGASYIPEGTSADPYAEPALPPMPVVNVTKQMEEEREQRWKEHVKKIEKDGERYDPNKPKYGDGIY